MDAGMILSNINNQKVKEKSAAFIVLWFLASHPYQQEDDILRSFNMNDLQ